MIRIMLLNCLRGVLAYLNFFIYDEDFQNLKGYWDIFCYESMDVILNFDAWSAVKDIFR